MNNNKQHDDKHNDKQQNKQHITKNCKCFNSHLVPHITKSLQDDGDSSAVGSENNPSSCRGSSPFRRKRQQQLDDDEASFVYIPTYPSSTKHSSGTNNGNEKQTNGMANGVGGGLADVSKHLELLVQIASTSNLDESEDDSSLGDMPNLCRDCIERVASAIQVNTKRIENECQAYKDAVTREEDQCRRVRRVIAANLGLSDIETNDNGGDENDHGGRQDGEDLIHSTIVSFQNEIDSLQQACYQHEQELRNIEALLSEQSIRSVDLYTAEEDTLSDLNDLELNSKVFQSTNRTFSKHYQSTQKEVNALSRISLPPMLFDVVVDDRGLRYPLVNELRLAYRPKGDLKWKEIDGAWSQAAQLLMFVGGVVNFIPKDDGEGNFRVVPLASQAKIIHTILDRRSGGKRKKVVYTLGRNSGRTTMERSSSRKHSNRGGADVIATGALCAFHSLLFQLVMHVTSSSNSPQRVIVTTSNSTAEETNPPPPPYKMSRTKIGIHDLSQLQERDDSSWSAVIHCMASNLKWLAQYSGHFSNSRLTSSLGEIDSSGGGDASQLG